MGLTVIAMANTDGAWLNVCLVSNSTAVTFALNFQWGSPTQVCEIAKNETFNLVPGCFVYRGYAILVKVAFWQSEPIRKPVANDSNRWRLCGKRPTYTATMPLICVSGKNLINVFRRKQVLI